MIETGRPSSQDVRGARPGLTLRPRILSLIRRGMAAAVLLLCAGASHAQDLLGSESGAIAPAPDLARRIEPKIARIEVTGNKSSDTRLIVRTSGLAEGEPAGTLRIRGAVTALYALGLFSDIRVNSSTDSLGGRVLTIAVVENAEAFWRHECVLPEVDLAVYSSGRLSERVIEWLASEGMSGCPVVHWGDYDPVGCLEYLRLRAKCGDRTRMHLPGAVAEMLTRFEPQLRAACVGQVSEIADGDAPHAARGCFAQAWSVAELLRVAVEDGT